MKVLAHVDTCTPEVKLYNFPRLLAINLSLITLFTPSCCRYGRAPGQSHCAVKPALLLDQLWRGGLFPSVLSAKDTLFQQYNNAHYHLQLITIWCTLELLKKYSLKYRYLTNKGIPTVYFCIYLTHKIRHFGFEPIFHGRGSHHLMGWMYSTS